MAVIAIMSHEQPAVFQLPSSVCKGRGPALHDENVSISEKTAKQGEALENCRSKLIGRDTLIFPRNLHEAIARD
jgi:hypothetical protein